MAELPYILKGKFVCYKWENLEGWCSICHMQKLSKQNSEGSHACNNEFPQISQVEFDTAYYSVFSSYFILNFLFFIY